MLGIYKINANFCDAVTFESDSPLICKYLQIKNKIYRNKKTALRRFLELVGVTVFLTGNTS